MENGEIIRRVYDAFAKGDIPAVLAAFDENISWTEAEGFMYGGTYSGPNAVLENVFMKLGTEWEGFSAVSDQIIDGGDNVVALGNYSGKFLETGKSVTVPFAHVHGHIRRRENTRTRLTRSSACRRNFKSLWRSKQSAASRFS